MVATRIAAKFICVVLGAAGPMTVHAEKPRQTENKATLRMHPASKDLFAPQSWLPPPPPVVIPKVEAPRAPALPFTYIGKILKSDGVIAYVSQGELNHALKAGDSLPNYRVERITDHDMTFVYVPLNQKQTLSFGSAK